MEKVSVNTSQYFQIQYRQSNKKTAITMQINLPFVSTKYLPMTGAFLQAHNPSVLRTQCFNDANLPFDIEVKETELGHLFEHILLDQLCLSEMSKGAKSSTFSGRTSWDWQKNPYGMFEIWIDIGKEQLQLLMEALKKTIALFEKLIFISLSQSHTNAAPALSYIRA